MTSKQQLARVGEYFTKVVPHCRLLGIEPVKVASGNVKLLLPYQGYMLGNAEFGFLHGGVLTSLLDTASAMAALTMVDETEHVVTLDLRIDNMRPAIFNKPLYAQAECFRLTTHIAFVRARCYQQNKNKWVATSQSTFMRLLGKGVPLLEDK